MFENIASNELYHKTHPEICWFPQQTVDYCRLSVKTSTKLTKRKLLTCLAAGIPLVTASWSVFDKSSMSACSQQNLSNTDHDMTINIDKIQNVYPFSFSAYNSEDKCNNLCSQINDVCQISSILFRILIAGINTKQPAGFWLIVLHRRQFTSNCNNTLVQPCCEYFAIIKGKGKGSTVICKDCRWQC